MSETVQIAIIVALTGVVGPALMAELRDLLRRRRKDARKRRRRRLRALDETSVMLSSLIDVAQHQAVGDLEVQRERARRGKKLLEVSPEDRKVLGDAEALGATMIPIDRYPSIAVRIARRVILSLNRLKVSRVGWAKRPPEGR